MSQETINTFSLTLTEDKRAPSYRLLAVILTFLNGFVIYYLAYINRSRYVLALIVCLIVFPLFIYALFKTRKLGSPVIPIWLVYTLGWAFFGYPLIAIINLLVILFAQIVFRNLLLKFSPTVITSTIPYKKKIDWVELDQVILRDGLLTLDFKNNKIIQRMIDETNIVNEQDFNEFCQQQLKNS